MKNGGNFMSEKTKNILYGVVVALLNAAMALFTALNIITWVSVNDIIFLFVFSKSLWIVSLMTLVFHIGKLFDRFYEKIGPCISSGSYEIFPTSRYLLPPNKAYKRLKCANVILLLISIVMELIVFLIK